MREKARTLCLIFDILFGILTLIGAIALGWALFTFAGDAWEYILLIPVTVALWLIVAINVVIGLTYLLSSILVWRGRRMPYYILIALNIGMLLLNMLSLGIIRSIFFLVVVLLHLYALPTINSEFCERNSIICLMKKPESEVD